MYLSRQISAICLTGFMLFIAGCSHRPVLAEQTAGHQTKTEITPRQPGLPDTPAGQRAGELLDILNQTGSVSLDDYIQTRFSPEFRDAFPPAVHKGAFQQTANLFGRLEIAGVQENSPYEMTVILKSVEKDQWLNLIVTVESAAPYRVALLGLRPASKPDEHPANESAQKKTSAMDQPSLQSGIQAVNHYIQTKSDANEFSGAVLIAKDGQPVYKMASGLASKTYNVPNTPDTKFNLGSINKVFTSVALARLMEQGKVAIDDPIGKYLDGFPAEIAEHVTIRHLLDMTSGWGDYWNNDYYLAHKDELRSLSDYMAFIRKIPLDFEPGSNFEHSNIGYEVAGAIIEAVTGMDYFDYIRENIYRPLRMDQSDSYHRDDRIENLATGYTNMNPADSLKQGYEWSNTYILSPRGTPAGGGYSTVDDLLKFDRGLRNNQLLSSQYTGYYLRRFRGSPNDPVSYPTRLFQAVGGADGVSAVLAMDFQTGYTIIVLSNYDFPVALDAANAIIRQLGLN